jgi:TonB family protein
MGYQALLFCPEEKTARTVTQVLSELDFEVVPCTEPFAAVKKLMGEHFDAVVVDCDNEQNATLLFKSARNAPNNQSALAVAVVEGQAGVAKAFRLGANLVLTKPINVEQAKGTLRVARGLLRKSESAKPASAATKPVISASVPEPGKPALVPSVSSTRSASAVSPLAAPSAPQNPVEQPSFAVSASRATIVPGESTEVASPKIVAASTPEPKREITSGKTQRSVASNSGLSVVTSSGAASAAAPAREAAVATQDVIPTIISPTIIAPTVNTKLETSVVKDAVDAVGQESSAVEASASPVPSFTFGGTVESDAKSAGGGSKKTLIAVAAVVLIAAGGYAAWTQFGHASGTATASAPAAVRPAPATPAPQHAPSAAVTAQESAASSAATSSQPAIPSSSAATPTTDNAKTSASAQTTSAAGNTQSHPSKGKTGVESSKPAAVVAENKAPVTAEGSQPIMVKTAKPRRSSLASDAAAPGITGIASTGNGGTLPNLLGHSNSAPAPVLQTLSISQGVSQGLVIKKVAPSYPANALRLRVEGSVQLLATISRKGDISAVKILSGEPSLAKAAADAVKQWKYKPYLLDGSPVEIQTQVTVNFKLPR